MDSIVSNGGHIANGRISSNPKSGLLSLPHNFFFQILKWLFLAPNLLSICLLVCMGTRDVHASPAQTMLTVSANQSHALTLTDGKVLKQEQNDHGQLENSMIADSYNFVEVMGAERHPLSTVGIPGGADKGVTIITHGFQFGPASNRTVPGWVKAMGAAILTKHAKKGRLWQFDVHTGLLKDLSVDCGDSEEQIPCGFNEIDGELVILVNWVGTSNNGTPGFAEAAGHALYSLLVGGARFDGATKKYSGPVLGDLSNAKPIHFIGHSFGTVVNSEAIQRLGYFFPSINVDHVTTLDPHDFDQGPMAGYDDGVPNVYKWNNVSYLDNYYQTIGPAPIGRKIYGAQKSNRTEDFSGYDLTGNVCFEEHSNNRDEKCNSEWENIWEKFVDDMLYLDEGAEYFGPHARVHTFYHGTIDTSLIGSEKVGGLWVRKSWYPDGLEDKLGYAYSRLGGKKNRDKDFPPKEHHMCLINPSSFNEGEITPEICKSERGYVDDKNIDEPPENLFGGSFTILKKKSEYPGFSEIPIVLDLIKSQKTIEYAAVLKDDLGAKQLKTQLNYIPKNATQLSFEWYVIRDDSFFPDELTITIDGVNAQIQYQIPVVKTTGWYTQDIMLPESMKGKSATVEMVLSDHGLGTLGSTVRIDNIRFSTIPLNGSGIALVLDRSGSMNKPEDVRDSKSPPKIDRAKQAVRALVKTMPALDEVSIATFSNEGETPLLMKKAGMVKGELDKVLSTITPSGGTNIGEGLSKGLEELEKASADQKMAILLSDGEHNVGDWKKVLKVVGNYEKEKWPICTLGFGKDANEEKLEEIAGDTGCVYRYVETLGLINSFQELSAYAQNKSIVLSIRDLLLSREILNYGFNVEKNADSFSAYTSWQGSKLSTKLISPSGKVITDAEARSTGGRYEEGKTFQMLEVEEPVPGLWNIEVSWAEAPPIPEQVNITVAEKSDIFTWMNGFRPMYSINEAVTINVNAANVVNNKKIPLRGGVVTAEIIKPGADIIRMIQAQSTQWTMFKDVLQNNTREVTLYDDGSHNDYKAGDGVFGGIYRETEKNGAYLVNATIRGEKPNGESVEKLITGSFQVGPIANNPVTSSQSLVYTKEARRHFQRTSPTQQELKSTDSMDSIEQLENSADPLDAIDQLNGSDPLDSIDSLMRSGG